MNLRRTLAVLGAGALTVTAVVGASPSAWADDPLDVGEARAELVGNVGSEVMSAMRDEFGLSNDEVYDRLAYEAVAADVEDLAEQAYGAYYG
ncbi:MAG: hypothetical protein ACRD0P_31985, partial [Stackebrandtia sp.]